MKCLVTKNCSPFGVSLTKGEMINISPSQAQKLTGFVKKATAKDLEAADLIKSKADEIDPNKTEDK